MTTDVGYDDKKWMPILPANKKDRWPAAEEKDNYRFARDKMEADVIDPFQDAGENLRAFKTP